MLNYFKNKKIRGGGGGFTLIELLVVIAIIGLLSSVVLASLNGARMKARDVKRIADIRSLQIALESYYNDFGYYPYVGWESSKDATWQTGGLANALRLYISNLHTDPVNDGEKPNLGSYSYAYYSVAYLSYSGQTQQWYMIVFRFENQNHPAQTTDGSLACDSTQFHYGNNADGIMTVGGNCIK